MFWKKRGESREGVGETVSESVITGMPGASPSPSSLCCWGDEVGVASLGFLWGEVGSESEGTDRSITRFLPSKEVEGNL